MHGEDAKDEAKAQSKISPMPPPTARSPRYSLVAIVLHWLIALAMGAMILLGENMYDSDARPIEWMFQLHKSIGITVLILTIARIIWRIMNPPPALPKEMGSWEKMASHSVHMGFYGLMILLPLSGWLVVSLSPFAIATVLFGLVPWPHLPFLAELPLGTREALFPTIAEIHHILSKALILLVVLHVAGAIKHELGAEEGVLKRMLPGLFGKSAAPERPRGASLAFGSALIVFGAIAGPPMVGRALSGSPNLERIALDAQNWTVDYTASEIAFSGLYSNNPFRGSFERWTAAIAYDPSRPETVSATLRVETGSARTGQTLYDSTLEGAEWFNTSAFPTATVTVEGAEQDETGQWRAIANMQIKDRAVPVPLIYQVAPGENNALEMSGTATLSRAALNMGQQSDANAAWVSDAIEVEVRILARPSEG